MKWTEKKKKHLFDCKINFALVQSRAKLIALVQTINNCNLAQYIWFGSVSVGFFNWLV